MTELTVIYDNYKFDIQLIGAQINIKLTEIELFNLYEAIINESEIYVKPIKKFYSMFIKALNKEPDFNLTIYEKKRQLICNFGYNNEFVNIEETITFTKIDTEISKELLLVERIKELTELTTPVFGYRGFGEFMKFDLYSKVIDFRPFDDYTRYSNFPDYNKFKKVNKIIISTSSKIFCGAYNNIGHYTKCGYCPAKYGKKTIIATSEHICKAYQPDGTYMCSSSAVTIYIPLTKCINERCCRSESSIYGGHKVLLINEPINHFNHQSVFLPSVTEIEIYCFPYINLMRDFTQFGSLPNLNKLTLIQEDNTEFDNPFLDIHSMISTLPNKKLKHIILKNISSWIIPDTVDKAKLFAQINHIRLEII